MRLLRVAIIVGLVGCTVGCTGGGDSSDPTPSADGGGGGGGGGTQSTVDKSQLGSECGGDAGASRCSDNEVCTYYGSFDPTLQTPRCVSSGTECQIVTCEVGRSCTVLSSFPQQATCMIF